MTGLKLIYKVFLCILLCVCLMGCEKEKQKNNIPSGSAKNDEFVIKAYPTVYPTSKSVTWLLPFYSELTEKNMNEINRIVYEKGLDCQIRFIKTNPIIGIDYDKWLQEYEKENPIDIVNSGVWLIGDSHQVQFIESRMVLLNDYLETAETELLKEMYTEEEWKSVAINGNVYVVPEAAYQLTDGTFDVETGLYVFVNESYIDDFAGFDGTYASLRSIYNDIGDDSLHIVIDGLPGGTLLYGLLGYSTLFYEQLPYCEKTNRVINLVDGDEAKDLIGQVYEDLSSGLLINRQMSKGTSGTILAYVRGSRNDLPEGYQEYVISHRTYDFNVAGKYGISVNSTQKALAKHILAVCLSDPEILCQMYPGIDTKKIENRTEWLNTLPASKMAGIRLDLSEEQINRLRKFENLYALIMSDMYILEEDGRIMLNTEFNIEEEWKRLAEEIGSYADLCESANEQIRLYEPKQN